MLVKINKLLKEEQNLLKEEQNENKAEKTLQFIIDSNGGLTDKQIEALQELIDGGYIEAINDYELKIHN